MGEDVRIVPITLFGGITMGWRDNAKIADMVGKTYSKVWASKDKSELYFELPDGSKYVFYHNQDCCEHVQIEDICGDLADLVGVPLVMATEETSDTDPEDYKGASDYRESFTWTFYKFGTVKGYVTVRWLGESNGYYGEGVDLNYEGRAN